jgi:hypothetical protein
MTDEQRKAIDDAQAARKAAKDAYDVAHDRIEPLRMAFVQADHEVRRLLKSMNTTNGKTRRD